MGMQTTDDVEMSQLFADVTAKREADIRKDERARLGLLLDSDGEALTKFVDDPADIVKIIAYMLRLG